jgi:hypothetical protein
MSEDILQLTPEYKLNREWSIVLAAFLGGPLPAGYLIAENFRNLGKPDAARNTWIIAIIVTIAVVGLAYIMPAGNAGRSYFIPLVYILLTRLLVRQYQSKAILEHVNAGGPMYNGWKGALAGLIGCVIMVAVLVGAYFLIEGNQA